MDEKVDVFMPLYVSDYLRDTSDLSLEENGAYCRLLFHMWVRRGSVPLDHDRLARVVGADRKTWAKIWPVLERFFDFGDGQITQRRLVRELEKARARKLQGRSAAEERWRKKKDAPQDARALPEHYSEPCEPDAPVGPGGPSPGLPDGWTSPSPSESQSESQPSSASSSPAPDARARDPRTPGPIQRPPWRSGYEWCREFRHAWCRAYETLTCPGSVADGKAWGEFQEVVLDPMEESALQALWARRQEAFGRYLASDDDKLRQVRHSWPFFVWRFNDFRPDIPGRESSRLSPREAKTIQAGQAWADRKRQQLEAEAAAGRHR